MMAHRGLSASQPWMRADSHDGPELRLHLEAEYIDAALTFVSPPTSSCDARPDHTLWHLPFSIVSNRPCRFLKTNAEAFDFGHGHSLSMCGYHLGKVLRERINVLLEEEKGGTEGTQLSFIYDKGEFLHGGLLASKLVFS